MEHELLAQETEALPYRYLIRKATEQGYKKPDRTNLAQGASSVAPGYCSLTSYVAAAAR